MTELQWIRATRPEMKLTASQIVVASSVLHFEPALCGDLNIKHEKRQVNRPLGHNRRMRTK